MTASEEKGRFFSFQQGNGFQIVYACDQIKQKTRESKGLRNDFFPSSRKKFLKFGCFFLQVHILNDIKELHRKIDVSQLPLSGGGYMPYSHQDFVSFIRASDSSTTFSYNHHHRNYDFYYESLHSPRTMAIL